MKRAILVLCLLAMTGGTLLAAQTTDEIELTRQVIQTERQAIVTAAMQLTEEESQAFWPVYREYREARSRVHDRTVKLVKEYAESYETLGEDRAESMLREILDIRQSELDLKAKYIKKFKKALPTMKVVRFFQVENKMDAVIDFELATEIPLVRWSGATQ